MIRKFYIPLLFLTSVFAQNADSTMSLSGGLGSITIDGEIYNQIALRPVIPIGKLGIGLDFYLNINSNGDIHKEDYDFSDFESGARTLLDKIRFIKYGNSQDPFYFTFGNLDNVVLGNGILVNGYTNSLEYPSNRKLGLNFGVDFGTLGLEFVVSDFKYEPGLVGARLNYKILPGLDMGLIVATDVNQFAGLSNKDGDEYPDVYDHFPEDSDKWDEAVEENDAWEDIYLDYINSDEISFDEWFESLPLNHNTYNPTTSEKNDIIGLSFDLNYRLNEKIKLYSQAGTLISNELDLFRPNGLNDYSPGRGLVPIGLSYHLGSFQFLAEYRYSSRYFLYNYWDRSYEINRATVAFDTTETGSDEISTKENSLKNYGEMNGVYSQLTGNIANLLYLSTSYTYMKGEVKNAEIDGWETQNNNSFITVLSLKENLIPRLKKAEAFYQQKNVPNPFDFEFTETSLYGFVVGFQISQDMVIQYKSTTSFIMSENGIDYEPISTILVETQFAF
jgi:hypothetical protein